MGERLRLDKFLADMGFGARSQIKEAVKGGRIQVNGVVEKRCDRRIDLKTETVSFDGKTVPYMSWEYFMLNKPQGVVSAATDALHPTVVDLIGDRHRKDLFPVGRLDIDTEGLLLITNDGALAHRLLSPRHHVDKRYLAVIEGRLPEDAKERLEKGLILPEGTPTLPALLETEGGAPGEAVERRRVFLTLREGKFHQVKRMFEALGCQVVFLKRLSMGPLMLDEALKPGEYRPLRAEEIAALKNCM